MAFPNPYLTMRSWNVYGLLAALLLAVGVSAGCGGDELNQPASLQTPRAFAVARGRVCMSSTTAGNGGARPVLRECDAGQRGAIGLVVNQSGNSVGVVDMTRNMGGSPPRNPRLVDLDPARPGVNHISVGSTPVDVAAGRGTTAYAVNQADGSISVLNLAVLKALPERIVFDQAPKQALVVPSPAGSDTDRGTLVVALSHPARLWMHREVDCPFPSTDGSGRVERLAAPADTGCTDVPGQDDGLSIELPATVSDMVVGPDGGRLYVIYADAPYASVVALDDAALEDVDGCMSGDQPPCEVARIGLTFDCSNGVDDDGDGAVDTADPQCFGPRGAESPSGIGRNSSGACSNGVDDDGDGDIDRQDSDCLISGADSEDAPIVDDPTAVCLDGRDNDGDDAVDYPDDDACYGRSGQAETSTTSSGYASAAIDRFGNFMYVVDRAHNQVLVVDAVHLALIDAFDPGGRDRTPFSSQIGVPVPRSPEAVQARVDRDVVWCESGGTDCLDDDSHAIIRYDYGAFVATNSGYAYNLSSLTAYCERPEGAGSTDCQQVPEFPVSYNADACDCLACQQAGQGGCPATCDGIDQPRQACLGERVADTDGVRIGFNPNFELRDSEAQPSRLLGGGACETPNALVKALRRVATGSPDISCTSPLRPQPVALSDLTGPENSESVFDRDEFDRADLIRQSTVVLSGGNQLGDARRDAIEARTGNPVDPTDVIAYDRTSIHDQAVVDETWTVTWEGILPNTRRDDGIVAEQPGEVTVVGLDLCETGVRSGDRLTITSVPVETNACEAFNGESAADDFLSWTIDEVHPHSLTLSVIDEASDDSTFVRQLPGRDCFTSGVSYHIRAHDEWIVAGERSGLISGRTSVMGTCQPAYMADHPRVDGRVKTGELFRGPYLSFKLRAGQTADGETVAPRRGPDKELSYRFSVEQNFSADAFRTTTTLPTELVIEPGLPAGRLMIIPDPASNFVYIRSLSIAGDNAAFLLK